MTTNRSTGNHSGKSIPTGHFDDEATSNDEELLAEFAQLWAVADKIWDENENHEAFGGYVSADYMAVYEVLARLRGQITSVLEWGSGLGVATIMANRMGFDAYGIESESMLVEYSEELAERFAPAATFATGSFIPDEFEWNPASGDVVNRTVIDMPAAYEELEMELTEFDLIYAYPWPDEHQFFESVLREHGRTNAFLLIYDAREGIKLTQLSDWES